jgi:hypothetical protein
MNRTGNGIPDTRGVLGHLALSVLLELENELNIIVGISRRDMEMKVKYGLPRNLPVVGKDIETRRVERIDDGPGNDMRREDDCGKLGRGDIDKRQSVRPGYDKDMPEVYRINIEDRKSMIILIQDFGGRITLYDLAKNACTYHLRRLQTDRIYQKKV